MNFQTSLSKPQVGEENREEWPTCHLHPETHTQRRGQKQPKLGLQVVDPLLGAVLSSFLICSDSSSCAGQRYSVYYMANITSHTKEIVPGIKYGQQNNFIFLLSR